RHGTARIGVIPIPFVRAHVPTLFFAATAVAALFLLHCFILGGALLRWIGCRDDVTPLGTFYSLCLGMLVNMAGLFVLGILGWFQLPAIGGAALILFVAALVGWRIANPALPPDFASSPCSRPTQPNSSVAD